MTEPGQTEAVPNALPPGGVELPRPIDALWDAWHPHEAAALLAGVTIPWCVAAGRALDR